MYHSVHCLSICSGATKNHAMSPVASLSEHLPEPPPSSQPHVLLLGAAGFIGRHVHAALIEQGFRVTPVCRPSSVSAATGGVWKPLALEHMCATQDWLPHVSGIDVVINCVGILRQRVGERYAEIHHRMPQALAQACAQTGVRMIHTSALACTPTPRAVFCRANGWANMPLLPVARTIASCARV